MRNRFNLSGRVVRGPFPRQFHAEVLNARGHVISRSRAFATHKAAFEECAERILDEHEGIAYDLTPRAYVDGRLMPCTLIRASEVTA